MLNLSGSDPLAATMVFRSLLNGQKIGQPQLVNGWVDGVVLFEFGALGQVRTHDRVVGAFDFSRGLFGFWTDGGEVVFLAVDGDVPAACALVVADAGNAEAVLHGDTLPGGSGSLSVASLIRP